MPDPLSTACSAGSAVAMATNAAILLTDADRYRLWVEHVGEEVARVRIVDAMSRLCGWLRRLVTTGAALGDAWLALEEPALAMLQQVVAWSGQPPLPSPLVSAAEGVLPLFGVHATSGAFDPTEAPTFPLLHGAVEPLAALADDQLVDERSELRLVVRRIVQRHGWLDALLAFRSGEVVLRATDAVSEPEPTAPALDVADTTPRVADILERTDLCLALDLDGAHTGIRLCGPRLLLVAAARARDDLAALRDATLGPALDLLMQGLEDRVERASFPPWQPGTTLPARTVR